MSDVAVGLVAVGVGLLFCFFGAVAMRAVIAVWGAFAGFVLGAGLVSGLADDGFLGSALAWAVAVGTALVFALVAYLFYEVSVFVAMAAVGFALGTSVMVALGVSWSWLVVLVGVVSGVLLAVVAIVADLPGAILVAVTALGGASTAVFGVMLLVGTLDAADLDSGSTTEQLDVSWWWYALYGALAAAGLVVQLRTMPPGSARAAWAGGATRSA